MAILEATVSKSYGNLTVLDQVNLKLEKGKCYGLIGENGAGKTTLFRCLSYLEKFEGNITSPYPNLRYELRYLPAQAFFLSKITGWEYLKLQCISKGIEFEDFETKNLFNLPLNRYAQNYSTGMKKKLGITGLVLRDDPIWLLDEPFNGLDFESCLMLSELLGMAKEKGKTILLSSHIFSTLQSSCDELFWLKEGEIAEHILQKDFDQFETSLNQRTKNQIKNSIFGQ